MRDAAVAMRLTFLSHFVICLACTGLAFFAWVNDVPQTIWADDMSMMTSVIAALFTFTAVCLGWQAWRIDGRYVVDPSFGHLAEHLSVMFGFVGTAIGLSLQATALATGATSFGALATSLFTTACGGAAAIGIAVMTYNLEAGIGRARR